MERDANKPVRDDFATKQPATDEEREAAKPLSREEAEEAEAAEKQRQAEAAHFHVVYDAVQGVMDEVPDLDTDHSGLSVAEREAITLLYQARTATNEMGTYAAALQCKRWLNQALATLQPVLSVALEPELQKTLEGEYAQLQVEIGELKDEIRSRILKEAHKGRLKAPAKSFEGEGEGDGSRTELGSLAWELAQLVKKRKRTRLPYDASAHPVIAALDAMQAAALELGKLALALSRAEGKRAKDLREASQAAVDQAVANLDQRLREFLDTCREGADDAAAPGAHPVLAERFAPLVARLEDALPADAVVRLSTDVIAEIHACLDQVDEIVAAAADGAAPDKKRGVLSSLFGRKKS